MNAALPDKQCADRHGHQSVQYQKAVQDGWMAGVEIVVLCIKWSKTRGRLLEKSIPINLYSEYGPQNKIDNL